MAHTKAGRETSKIATHNGQDLASAVMAGANKAVYTQNEDNVEMMTSSRRMKLSSSAV